jgi:hypothetical protein
MAGWLFGKTGQQNENGKRIEPFHFNEVVFTRK